MKSAGDFKRRLDEEFDFMVTPLVFDLSLNFISSSFYISDVYGNPGNNNIIIIKLKF